MNTLRIAIATILFSSAVTLNAQDAGAFDVAAAWEKDCQKCHAKDGSGLTKKGRQLRVRDYRKPEVQAKITDEEMLDALRHGVEKDGEQTMNAYAEDYTEAEMEAFVAYIRTMAKQ